MIAKAMNSCPLPQSHMAVWGTRRFFCKLGDVTASDGCASKAALVTTVRQEPSCALCRCKACMYDLSLLAFTAGDGRGFMPRLERAVNEASDVNNNLGLSKFLVLAITASSFCSDSVCWFHCSLRFISALPPLFPSLLRFGFACSSAPSLMSFV